MFVFRMKILSRNIAYTRLSFFALVHKSRHKVFGGKKNQCSIKTLHSDVMSQSDKNKIEVWWKKGRREIYWVIENLNWGHPVQIMTKLVTKSNPDASSIIFLCWRYIDPYCFY